MNGSVKLLLQWWWLICGTLVSQYAWPTSPTSANLPPKQASSLSAQVTQTLFNDNASRQPSQQTQALLVHSGAALVAHGTTGRLFFQKNIHQLLSIASITKLMMAMVILDADLSMDENITIMPEDVDVIKHSRSRLAIGTTLLRRDALLLAIMSSENRAAFALARTYPGGTSAFVEAMNQKAKSLKMFNTIFYDPTGLDARNVSTAADLLTMVKAAYQYAWIKNYSTQRTYTLKTKTGSVLSYQNSNPIVHDDAWHIKLQKTGFTREAGRCMVAYATINSRPYIFVLLAARSTASRGEDAYLLKTSLEQNRCFWGVNCADDSRAIR